MIATVNSRDRIILFTLIDLLIQIIFFGFLLFVLHDQSERERKQVSYLFDELTQKYGVVNLTRFLEALSRLIPIEELERVIVMLESIESGKFKAWSDLLAISKTLDVSPEELKKLAELYGSLDREDRGRLLDVMKTYSRASKQVKERIYSSTLLAGLPDCYNGSSMLNIKAVENKSFQVSWSSDLNQIAPEIFQTVKQYGYESGNSFLLTWAQFEQLGSSLRGLFRDCRIRVKESSLTDSREALLIIQRYFRTTS